ncbi:MAG: cache domain-containing protein, partial [Zoogloea sp.]|nr:cache domain-containing protein [Zoogloea sp.]
MAAGIRDDSPSRHFRFPLHIHISTLFFLLVLMAGGSIAAFSYFRSAEMLERAAGDLLTRISRQTVAETESLLHPVEASVRLLALNAVSDARTLAERRVGLGALREALQATPSVSAYYVGYASGDFFLLMRLADDADRRLVGAPAGAAYLIQSIAGSQGLFIYLDADLHELRADPRPDYRRLYDPRQRGWYIQAQGSLEPVQTAPYLFASTHRLGVTVAHRVASGRAVVGADIRLATLDETLRRQRITPGSLLVLFDATQRVVACTEPGWLLPEAAGGSVERPRVAELTHEGLAALARQAPQSAEGGDQTLSAFDGAGRSWHGAVASLPVQGGQALSLGVAIPDDELLTDARSIRDRAILATLLVILLALPFTYGAARLVSRPIRELAREAAAIRRFDFAGEVVTHSVVREVDDLARDLASMKGSVRRFLDIASVMAEEPDFERLLPRLVDETVGVVGARAGV